MSSYKRISRAEAREGAQLRRTLSSGEGWSGAGLEWFDPAPVSYKPTKHLQRIVDNSVSVGKYQPVPRVQTFKNWMSGVGGVSNVDFDTPSRKELLKSFKNCLNLKNWVIPQVPDKVLYLHTERLRHTLLWWDQNRFLPGKPAFMDPEEVMLRNLEEGPVFADYLSDLWKYRYRHHLGEWTRDEPPHLEYAGELPSYSYLFPAKYLIPFKTEDPEDWRLGLDYLPQDPTFDVAAFKEHVKEHIRRGVMLPTVDDFDVADFAGSTKTWTSLTGKNMTRSEYLAKRAPELTGQFEFKYSPVQKTADEFRCSVIASPDTLFTINACMRQLNAINKNKIDCMHLSDTSWIAGWCSGHYTYLMLDQRKCGITFSKDLMKETCEAILEVYPESYFSYFIRGLENHTLYVNGDEFHPKRGLGLGMANELVSFTMACLMSFFFETRQDENYQGLVFNDDQIIRVEVDPEDPSERAYSHFKKWKKFMTKAGLEVHPGKSYYSNKAGVFLEEYGGHLGTTLVDKDVCYAMGVFYALMAPNMGAAKAYVSDLSNLELATSDKFVSAIEYVISLVGYEFTPAEIAYPYPIGWVNERVMGYNMLFTHFNPDDEFSSAFWNVLAVGGIPSIGQKQLAEGFGGYAAPFNLPIMGPASRGNWLRKLKRWSDQRLQAFHSAKDPDPGRILAEYTGRFPDKYWLDCPELVQEPPIPIRMDKRELYLLGQSINPTGEARVDPARSRGHTFLRFSSTGALSYFMARAAEVGTEIAYHDTAMGGWAYTACPQLPYDSLLSVGDYHVFCNCKEIDNEVRMPTNRHVAPAIWYLTCRLAQDSLGPLHWKEYLIDALDALEIELQEAQVHPEEEDTGGTLTEGRPWNEGFDPELFLHLLHQVTGTGTTAEEILTRGEADAAAVEQQRRNYIASQLERYAMDASSFFGEADSNSKSEDEEPLGFGDLEF